MEGEDKIIVDYFKNIKNGFYVDAGCYHPTHLSNTHILFTKNSKFTPFLLLNKVSL